MSAINVEPSVLTAYIQLNEKQRDSYQRNYAQATILTILSK